MTTKIPAAITTRALQWADHAKNLKDRPTGIAAQQKLAGLLFALDAFNVDADELDALLDEIDNI